MSGLWTSFAVRGGALPVAVACDERGVTRLHLRPSFENFTGQRDDAHPLLVETRRQLEAYFDGRLRTFDLPLALDGTSFQQRVWNQLLLIPYGETRTYAQLAATIESPRAIRAVGSANGANPVAVIVPCHRVINTGGGLGGYASGLDHKRLLLGIEGVRMARSTRSRNSDSRSMTLPIFNQ
jgi:methylated-DNA-[protein]-cysteine S-methyltransferase